MACLLTEAYQDIGSEVVELCGDGNVRWWALPGEGWARGQAGSAQQARALALHGHISSRGPYRSIPDANRGDPLESPFLIRTALATALRLA